MSELARDRCSTCSDEAVVAEVVSVDGFEAVVRVDGQEDQRVAVDLVPDAEPGDLLLCHAGIALEGVAQPRRQAEACHPAR
jgi:hydrogenase maturation factor